MSKFPTKAAENEFCVARLNAAKFNDKLRSREGAAEVLGIDRTRLARVELGSLIPYPEEVLLMADCYGAPELLNHFCTECCPIGCRSQQKLECADLERLALRILASMRNGESMKDMLLEITADGQIQPDERDKLNRVIEFFEAIGKAAAELKLWSEKNLDERGKG